MVADRLATHQKSFGHYRAEVLAALVNASILLLISIYILYGAYNVVGIRLLSGSAEHSVSAKAAYLEVLSDALGSVGVIAASIIIMTTGWHLADPIFGAAIGLFILPRTWKMLKDTAQILMEGVPAKVNLHGIEAEMLKISGVATVHDIHVWTLTSGIDSMSGHVCVFPSRQFRLVPVLKPSSHPLHAFGVLPIGLDAEIPKLLADFVFLRTRQDPKDGVLIMNSIRNMLEERFGISHTTIQVEDNRCRPSGLGV